MANLDKFPLKFSTDEQDDTQILSVNLLSLAQKWVAMCKSKRANNSTYDT